MMRTPVSRLERLLTRLVIGTVPSGGWLFLADLRLDLRPDLDPVRIGRDVLRALEHPGVEDRLRDEDRRVVEDLLGDQLLRLVVRRGVGVRARLLGLERASLDDVGGRR